MKTEPQQQTRQKQVALFVTCLIDNLRPSIGLSVVKLLERCGYEVIVPPVQTCCGQPNYNSGDKKNAQRTARVVVDAFMDFEYVIIPSGSCGGMIKYHYPDLLSDDANYSLKARQLAARVYELSSFLVDIADYHPGNHAETLQHSGRTVTYHDACAGLRELGIKQQPRELLVDAGLSIIEMSDPEVCCGFGGTFSIKYPDVSDAMVNKKILDAMDTGADAIVTGDLGCLMNMQGKLHRQGVDLPVLHFAELLAADVVSNQDTA